MKKTVNCIVLICIIFSGLCGGAFSGLAESNIKKFSTRLTLYGSIYWYSVPNDERKVYVWIPPEMKTVRGLIFVGNPGTGDNLLWLYNNDIKTFAARMGFGLMTTKGMDGTKTFTENGEIIIRALEEISQAGLNPEMRNVPFITSGGSSGGAAGYGLANYAPQRTIAFTVNVPSTPYVPSNPVPAALKVPGIFIAGEWDVILPSTALEMRSIARKSRAQGSLWSWMIYQGMGHEHRLTGHFYYPFWEKMINLRCPKDADPLQGPIRLKDVAESKGWLAEDLSYPHRSAWTAESVAGWEAWGFKAGDPYNMHVSCKTGLVGIAPYAKYRDNKTRACWLPDQDMAFLFRALASWNPMLSLGIEGYKVVWKDADPLKAVRLAFTDTKIYRPGDTIKLVCTVAPEFTGWSKIEFYLGSKKIGVVKAKDAAGPTKAELSYTLKPQPVAQSFTVLGYDAKGKPVSSAHMINILIIGEKGDK
ncbi:MAG: hypothetical protein ACM3WV_12230 [Bacillota bacterium]